MNSSYRTQIPVMEESLLTNKLKLLTNSKINLLKQNYFFEFTEII